MPRPIHEKLQSVGWWGEQAAHAGAGGLAAIPFALVFSFALGHPAILIAGFLCGALAGSIRELIQNWNDAPEDNDLLDSHFDSMGFQVGAFVVTLTCSFFPA